MQKSENTNASAFGHPGMDPRWTASTKEGIGTAYHSASRIWFTLSHGIINEIYYPTVDTPNTRDLQFLVTDGESFLHEERKDFKSQVEYPVTGALLYRLTNTEKDGRYRIIKEVMTDPHASVLLMNAKLEIIDADLKGKLKLYVLLAPHVEGKGYDNNAEVFECGGRLLLHAYRETLHLMMGANVPFEKCSVGFVGASDGWQDLNQNFQMDWQFTEALGGNVALIAQLNVSEKKDFTVAVAMGAGKASAASALAQSLALPFGKQRTNYVEQWKRASSNRSAIDLKKLTPDDGQLFHLSQNVLMAHEDKIFPGAMIASMSIPWGEVKGDDDLGGYHLVWARDMMNSAMALLASGHRETPLRTLVWLSCVQDAKGCMPQNSWINGEAYWSGRQLDEVATPVLLAWALHENKALQDFDPWPLVARAARFLMLNGPVTHQDRWEENAGYSPSTLAAVISAMVCASEFAKARDKAAAQQYLDYADWLSANLEKWTVTTSGELLAEVSHHYVRINPANPDKPSTYQSPDDSWIDIKNGGGRHPAKNVVDGGFLELVRYGVRAANDTLIRNTVKVIDAKLKVELPQGPGWKRYNHDGYGQKIDGSPFDGTGQGGTWPLLTGERGHYELALGNDPKPFLMSLQSSANAGGMLPEQVWSEEFDLPEFRMYRGQPNGSAMPLCWAHAEYVSLVCSMQKGHPFARIGPVYKRYAQADTKRDSQYEMWTLGHQVTEISYGKTLRILTDKEDSIIYETETDDSRTVINTLLAVPGVYYVDIPLADSCEQIVFCFQSNQGQEFRVHVKSGKTSEY